MFCKLVKSSFSIGLALLFALNQPDAVGYIDPGSGSMILQAVLAIIFGAIVTLKLFWQKIKFGFLRLIGRKPQTSEPNSGDDSP